MLFIAGRADDMIISGGENVYPIELEEILAQHPLIEDSAVLGVKDPEFGERLIAFIQTKKNLKKTELLNWLRPKVARYQMPKELIFLEKIPYNNLGKVNQHSLKKLINS